MVIKRITTRESRRLGTCIHQLDHVIQFNSDLNLFLFLILQVSLQMIEDKGGGGLISNQYGGSLYFALETCYPEFIWTFLSNQTSSTTITKAQRFLYQIIRMIFFGKVEDTGDDILLNYKHPQLYYPKSGR